MKGVTDISNIKYAILETNGQISVLPFSNQLPPTAKDMNIAPQENGLPLVLINDGHILEHNLKLRGYDHNWLEKQLHSHGLKDPKKVYLLTADEKGQTYFVAKEEEK